MESDSDNRMLQSLQRTYQNTLKFTPGQSVHIYRCGTRHTFHNVTSFVVDVAHSLITILTPNGPVLFRNWDGIELGKGQLTPFVVSSEA